MKDRYKSQNRAMIDQLGEMIEQSSALAEISVHMIEQTQASIGAIGQPSRGLSRDAKTFRTASGKLPRQAAYRHKPSGSPASHAEKPVECAARHRALAEKPVEAIAPFAQPLPRPLAQASAFARLTQATSQSTTLDELPDPITPDMPSLADAVPTHVIPSADRASYATNLDERPNPPTNGCRTLIRDLPRALRTTPSTYRPDEQAKPSDDWDRLRDHRASRLSTRLALT